VGQVIKGSLKRYLVTSPNEDKETGRVGGPKRKRKFTQNNLGGGKTATKWRRQKGREIKKGKRGKASRVMGGARPEIQRKGTKTRTRNMG